MLLPKLPLRGNIEYELSLNYSPNPHVMIQIYCIISSMLDVVDLINYIDIETIIDSLRRITHELSLNQGRTHI